MRRVLVMLAVMELLAVGVSGRLTREMPDLEVYWTAAQRFVAAEPLYRAEDGHYQFKYLPAAALLLSPLAALPLPEAKAGWLFLSIAVLVTFVALSLRLPLQRSRPAWLALALVIAGMGKFFAHELVLGQINLLFGLVVVVALLAIRRGGEPVAGALFALAIAIKPYAVLFLPWLAARRRWPALAAATLGLLAVFAAPAIQYGIGGTFTLHREWLDTVTASTAPNLANADNISLAGAATKWFGSGALARAVSGFLALCLFAAAAMVVVRRHGVSFAEGLEGALILTLIPLMSPQGWDYVLLLATPALVYVATCRDVLPRGLEIAAITAVLIAGLTLYDVVGRSAYAAFMQASVVTVSYLVVVAALCTIRLRRGA